MKQELKGNIDKWLSDDEEGIDELNSTFTLNKENTSPQENSRNSNESNNTRDELKNQLLQEVERRAEEKSTYISVIFCIVVSGVESLNRTKWNLLRSCVCYIFTSFSVYLKESICETRKNVFYFTSKALFILEIINF